MASSGSRLIWEPMKKPSHGFGGPDQTRAAVEDLLVFPGDLPSQSVEARLANLANNVKGLHALLLDTRHLVPTADSVREVAAEVYEEKAVELEKLRDDAIKIIQVFIRAGVVTQEDLNAAVEA
jgi:hypothetical protein